MNAEFNWWLLLLGALAGGALTWLVLAEFGRRDREIDEDELRAEAAWLARTLSATPTPVTPEAAEAVLRAHRRYLGFPPPDTLVDPDELVEVAAPHPPEPGPPGPAPG